MTVSARIYRLAIAVVGLAVLAWLAWQNLSGQPGLLSQSTGGYAQRIDAAQSWQYDKQGQLAYRLVSARVTHLDETDRYRLDSPVTTLFDEGPAPPWTVNADEGEVRDKGGVVDLQDNVIASRAPFGETGRLEMRTEALRIRPNERQAESRTPTRLSESTADGATRWTSDSERLDLDWAAERLTQTGRVQDHIEPASAP